MYSSNALIYDAVQVLAKALNDLASMEVTFARIRNKKKVIKGLGNKKTRQTDRDDCDDCNDCRTCNSSHWIATLWQRRVWGAGGSFFLKGMGG